MFFKTIQTCLTAFALLIGATSAPWAETSGAGSITFNLLSYEGVYLNRIFRFDAGYTEKYGIPVPVPFVLEVPIRQDVELIADGRPSGGLVKFTFATKDTEPRAFIENFHVVGAVFPRQGEGTEAQTARQEIAARALINSAFPAAIKGFSQAKILTNRAIEVNGIAAVEVIGTYQDPANGPMVLRLVALPHPDRDESYFVIHNISQTLVPITGPEQMPQTLGGRVLNSFTYE